MAGRFRFTPGCCCGESSVVQCGETYGVQLKGPTYNITDFINDLNNTVGAYIPDRLYFKYAFLIRSNVQTGQPSIDYYYNHGISNYNRLANFNQGGIPNLALNLPQENDNIKFIYGASRLCSYPEIFADSSVSRIRLDESYQLFSYTQINTVPNLQINLKMQVALTELESVNPTGNEIIETFYFACQWGGLIHATYSRENFNNRFWFTNGGSFSYNGSSSYDVSLYVTRSVTGDYKDEMIPVTPSGGSFDLSSVISNIDPVSYVAIPHVDPYSDFRYKNLVWQQNFLNAYMASMIGQPVERLLRRDYGINVDIVKIVISRNS